MLKTILFLASNPLNTDRLRLDEEIREIDEGLRRSEKRNQFTIQQKWALRPDDLRRAMLDFEPHIVHFSGHGAGSDGIILEDNSGNPTYVSTEALSGFFELFPNVECVILNACFSAAQANAIVQHVRYVIGMQQQIGDVAAIRFAVSFYDALGAGKSIEYAYKLGCNAIHMAGVSEHLIPVFVIRETDNFEVNDDFDDFEIYDDGEVEEAKTTTSTGVTEIGIPRLPKLENGEQFLNRFKIKGFIGRGGFSDAYIAWDQSKDTEVVVKRFPQAEELQHHLNRFIERENKISRKLSSRDIPGLVKTYETIHDKYEVCLVQEHIPGNSLYQRLEDKKIIDVKEAIHTVINIGKTLADLHKLKIVHCDVKPLNIIISSPGNPTLIDLGAARFFDEQLYRQDIVVSVPYSPAELLTGNPIDGRTDQYSLGMTLLHMLTGLPKFVNIDETMPFVPDHVRIGEVPSAETIREHIKTCLWEIESKSLRSIIERVLSDDFDNRYESMTAFCEALNECFEEYRNPLNKYEENLGSNALSQISEEESKTNVKRKSWLSKMFNLFGDK